MKTEIKLFYRRVLPVVLTAPWLLTACSKTEQATVSAAALILLLAAMTLAFRTPKPPKD